MRCCSTPAPSCCSMRSRSASSRQRRAIDALLLETKSGRVAVRAATFIDCSGDGDLAHFAGVAMEKGDAGGALLYPTLMFRVGNVDAARAGEAWRTIPERMDEAEAAGEFRFPRRGAIVRPQKHAVRVAGQRHPAEERRRQRHRRHRCALAFRAARSRAGARRSTTCASCAPGCPASRRPTRSRSRRSSASARPGGWSARSR